MMPKCRYSDPSWFAVTATESGWVANVPNWRFDIAIEEDLVEGIARIYGYDNIPNIAPEARLTMSEHKEAEQPLKRLRDVLVDRGFQEAITYSFIDPESISLLEPSADPIVLPNPLHRYGGNACISAAWSAGCGGV